MEISIYTWRKVKYIREKVEGLEKKFPKIKINFFEKADEKDYSNSKYILGVDMTLEDLEQAKKLEKIIVPYTGLNDFPMEEIEERGIEIVGSHVKAKYVAEKGLGLLLGIMGKVCEYDSGMRKGLWGPRSGMGNKWESLYNKKIGLLGAGSIGEEFVKIASSFTKNFGTLDRGRRYKGIEKYYETVEELAGDVDVIFVSLPLNRSTEGIIGREILEKFNGYIINIGRGRTIDEKFLYESLKNKDIKGAGIEVWYDYPKEKKGMPSKYPFHELENVIMSPHIATSNLEDRWAYFDDAFEKLERLIEENK